MQNFVEIVFFDKKRSGRPIKIKTLEELEKERENHRVKDRNLKREKAKINNIENEQIKKNLNSENWEVFYFQDLGTGLECKITPFTTSEIVINIQIPNNHQRLDYDKNFCKGHCSLRDCNKQLRYLFHIRMKNDHSQVQKVGSTCITKVDRKWGEILEEALKEYKRSIYHHNKYFDKNENNIRRRKTPDLDYLNEDNYV